MSALHCGQGFTLLRSRRGRPALLALTSKSPTPCNSRRSVAAGLHRNQQEDPGSALEDPKLCLHSRIPRLEAKYFVSFENQMLDIDPIRIFCNLGFLLPWTQGKAPHLEQLLNAGFAEMVSAGR